jgi:hypothetical protein
MLTVVNGKKKMQGIKYNRINKNGKPMVINSDRWVNSKHTRFSWINPIYKKTKKIRSLLYHSINLVPLRGMPISNGKKSKRKSKKKQDSLNRVQ